MSELSVKDVYLSEADGLLSNDELNALCSMYQPIIGSKALSLYLTLFQEANTQKGTDQHQHLLNILNIDINAFKIARIKLEEYGLLKSYLDEDKKRYIYIMIHPNNTDEFLANELFSRLLMKVLEKKDFEQVVLRYQRSNIDTSKMKNITKKFDNHIIDNWDEVKEMEYGKLKTNNILDNNDDYLTYTYQDVAAIPTLVLPTELKTKENIKVITEYATLYGLNNQQVCKVIGKCVNLSANTFSAEKFKYLASNSKMETKKVKDIYQLSPAQFLQEKQNGVPVQSADARLLEKLMIDMRLVPEVINVLIEYVLKTKNNVLAKAYVEKIASSLVRENITDKEAAKNYLYNDMTTSKPVRKSGKEVKMPEYTKETKKESKLTKEKEAELKERMRRLGGNNA